MPLYHIICKFGVYIRYHFSLYDFAKGTLKPYIIRDKDLIFIQTTAVFAFSFILLLLFSSVLKSLLHTSTLTLDILAEAFQGRALE